MTRNRNLAVIAGTLWALALASGCGESSEPGTETCFQGKCDLPADPADLACFWRRADAFNENQLAFTERFLRWSCADTEGVTGVDRGQEYCEYFTVIRIPYVAGAPGEPGPEPTIHGRLIEIPAEDPEEAPSYSTTPEELELTPEQILELERTPSAVVGQCVFTSWNQDIPGPVPACDQALADGDPGGCPEVLGVPIGEENFRMKFEVNSAEAAQFLVEDCFASPAGGDPEDPRDPLHDDFFRGCSLNADINETEFRKSDSTVCAAAMRLSECGCAPAAGEPDFPALLSPWERRGFPLGTWSGAYELPAGCRYAALGDASRTVVTCDLTAEEVLSYAPDTKGYCREKYAPNVVVHVPIPGHAVTCDPAASDSPYAPSCGPTPWVLSAY